MPKYLFTSDQRISVLPARIKWVADFINSGHSLSEISDKSDNNNAATLKFYYNLFSGTETCLKAASDPFFAIRNFVLKFQFPNVRTQESLQNTIAEKLLLAPFRSIVSLLFALTKSGNSSDSHITISEILYYVFSNPLVYNNPSVDYTKIAIQIENSRRKQIDLDGKISNILDWNQYGRQARELINVLTYASDCFKFTRGILYFSTGHPKYATDKDFINSLILYNRFWYPTNYNNFQLSILEYISYMNTIDTQFSVVEFTPNIAQVKKVTKDKTLQKITYGAPGTGKSFKIKKDLQDVKKGNIIRTTFHPDSDYASFVGCYKPSMNAPSNKVNNRNYTLDELAELLKIAYESADKKSLATDIFGITYAEHLKGEYGMVPIKELLDKAGIPEGYNISLNDSINLYHDFLKKQDSHKEEIIYSFTPQAFINAYIKAYQSPEEKVYLIIEEINRGNCAQIFGDLFQLLDRNEEGVSEYPIKADADLCAFLQKELGPDNKGIAGGELCLPPNLYIWATMNTSDQSLFPIDSAFKRRWDWEYIPIQYCNIDWKIVIGDLTYAWTEFQKNINDKIQNATNSEDKKIGDYFVNVKHIGGIISQGLLLNKIIFYLWNDVCKDDEGEIFRVKNGSDEADITFSEFFDKAQQVQKLQDWMNFLGVEPIENEESDNEDVSYSEEDNIQSKRQYLIDGKDFLKTDLAKVVFSEYIKKNSNQTINGLIQSWERVKNKANNIRNKSTTNPISNLITDIEGYNQYIERAGTKAENEGKNPQDAKKRAIDRWEKVDYNGTLLYVWKDWGDLTAKSKGNMESFITVVKAEWDINIQIK